MSRWRCLRLWSTLQAPPRQIARRCVVAAMGVLLAMAVVVEEEVLVVLLPMQI